jgi:hypothetical protein
MRSIRIVGVCLFAGLTISAVAASSAHKALRGVVVRFAADTKQAVDDMRHVKIIGLALVVMLAVSGITAGTAWATPKVLNLETHAGILAPGAELEEVDLFLALAASRGKFECEVEGSHSTLTTNGAKTDKITTHKWSYECTGPVSFSEVEEGVLPVLSLSATDKATAELKLKVPWPGYVHCSYSGKIKTSNTVLEGAGEPPYVRFSLSGKLKGTGCPKGNLTVSTLYPGILQLYSMERYEQGEPFEEVEGYYVT